MKGGVMEDMMEDMREIRGQGHKGEGKGMRRRVRV